MKVNADSWHYRRYQRWERWKQRTNSKYVPRKTLDLCHYMRVVLIFYPWRWPWQRRIAGTDLVPAGAFAAVVVFGLIITALVTVRNWALTGIVIGGIIAGVIVLVLCFYAGWWIFSEEKLHKRVARSDAWQLSTAYFKAKKRHICPLVEVHHPDELT